MLSTNWSWICKLVLTARLEINNLNVGIHKSHFPTLSSWKQLAGLKKKILVSNKIRRRNFCFFWLGELSSWENYITLEAQDWDLFIWHRIPIFSRGPVRSFAKCVNGLVHLVQEGRWSTMRLKQITLTRVIASTADKLVPRKITAIKQATNGRGLHRHRFRAHKGARYGDSSYVPMIPLFHWYGRGLILFFLLLFLLKRWIKTSSFCCKLSAVCNLANFKPQFQFGFGCSKLIGDELGGAGENLKVLRLTVCCLWIFLYLDSIPFHTLVMSL